MQIRATVDNAVARRLDGLALPLYPYIGFGPATRQRSIMSLNSPDAKSVRPACTCVVGLQWGDEAKGKLVDLLGEQHDFVVRYNGGANAGHTIVWGDRKFKLSLLPAGVLNPRLKSVIGNGVVVYPPRFLEEIEQLRAGRHFGWLEPCTQQSCPCDLPLSPRGRTAE